MEFLIFFPKYFYKVLDALIFFIIIFISPSSSQHASCGLQSLQPYIRSIH